MTKVKFGLTKKEQELYKKAYVAFTKAAIAQNKFYDTIKERFDKAGYDGEFVIDVLTSTDTYVFSQSGCTGDLEFDRFKSVWEYIEEKIDRYDEVKTDVHLGDVRVQSDGVCYAVVDVYPMCVMTLSNGKTIMRKKEDCRDDQLIANFTNVDEACKREIALNNTRKNDFTFK